MKRTELKVGFTLPPEADTNELLDSDIYGESWKESLDYAVLDRTASLEFASSLEKWKAERIARQSGVKCNLTKHKGAHRPWVHCAVQLPDINRCISCRTIISDGHRAIPLIVGVCGTEKYILCEWFGGESYALPFSHANKNGKHWSLTNAVSKCFFNDNEPKLFTSINGWKTFTDDSHYEVLFTRDSSRDCIFIPLVYEMRSNRPTMTTFIDNLNSQWKVKEHRIVITAPGMRPLGEEADLPLVKEFRDMTYQQVYARLQKGSFRAFGNYNEARRVYKDMIWDGKDIFRTIRSFKWVPHTGLTNNALRNESELTKSLFMGLRSLVELGRGDYYTNKGCTGEVNETDHKEIEIMQHFDFKVFRALGRPYSGITFFDDELDFGERIMYAVDLGNVLELPEILKVFQRGGDTSQKLFTAMMAMNVSHLNPVCLREIFNCRYRHLPPINLERAKPASHLGDPCYIISMSDGGGIARIQHDKVACIVAYSKYEGIAEDIASGDLTRNVPISDRLRRRGLQIKNKWRCEMVAKCVALCSSHIGDNPHPGAFKVQDVVETMNMLRFSGMNIPGIDHIKYTLVAEYTHPDGRKQTVKIRKERDYHEKLRDSNGKRKAFKLFKEITRVLKISNDYFSVRIRSNNKDVRLSHLIEAQDSDWFDLFEREIMFTYKSPIDWWLYDDVVTIWYMQQTTWNTTCSRERAMEICDDMLKFINELQHFLVSSGNYDPLRSRHCVARRHTYCNNVRDGDYFNKEFHYTVTDLEGTVYTDEMLRFQFKQPAHEGPVRDPVIPGKLPKYTYDTFSSWRV
jgi:hypothetical protein